MTVVSVSVSIYRQCLNAAIYKKLNYIQLCLVIQVNNNSIRNTFNSTIYKEISNGINFCTEVKIINERFVEYIQNFDDGKQWNIFKHLD